MRVAEKLLNLAVLNNGEFVRGKRESRAAFLASVCDESVYDTNDRRKIRRYATNMKRGDVFPPIFVTERDGELSILDGWHRCVATALSGRTKIRAVVIESASDKEAGAISEMLFAVDDPHMQLKIVAAFAAWSRAQAPVGRVVDRSGIAGWAKPTISVSTDRGQ